MPVPVEMLVAVSVTGAFKQPLTDVVTLGMFGVPVQGGAGVHLKFKPEDGITVLVIATEELLAPPAVVDDQLLEEDLLL
jgi:hypothetical protein